MKKSAKLSREHTKSFGKGEILPGKTIDIQALVDLIEGEQRKPESRSLKDLVRPSRSRKSGFSNERYKGTDVKYPLIIDQEGRLIDGRHRYFKAKDQGVKEMPVVPVSEEDLKRFVIKKSSKGKSNMSDARINPFAKGFMTKAAQSDWWKYLLGAGAGAAGGIPLGYYLSGGATEPKKPKQDETSIDQDKLTTYTDRYGTGFNAAGTGNVSDLDMSALYDVYFGNQGFSNYFPDTTYGYTYM